MRAGVRGQPVLVPVPAVLLSVRAWTPPLLPSEHREGGGIRKPALPSRSLGGDGTPRRGVRPAGLGCSGAAGPAGRQAESCRPPPGRAPARATEEELISLSVSGWGGAAACFGLPQPQVTEDRRRAPPWARPAVWEAGRGAHSAGGCRGSWDPAGLPCGPPQALPLPDAESPCGLCQGGWDGDPLLAPSHSWVITVSCATCP